MIDGHIHIERGDYTLEWIEQFVDQAVKMNLSEIRLLEHSYRFKEFTPMYATVCAKSEYVASWFKRSAGKHTLAEYFELIDRVKAQSYPVAIKFGLEICYFKEHEGFIEQLTKDKAFDFLLGSIHYADDFAFDHMAEHWEGIDVDRLYRKFFEVSISLAKSGLFDGIAHPDSIKLFGHRPSFSLLDYYEELARELSASGMYADQNSGITRRCPGAPGLGMDEKLLQALKRWNVRIVTSSDAHCPEDVGDKIAELEACVNHA